MNKTMISGLVVVMATATAALIGCGGGEGASTQQSGVKGSSSSSSGSDKPATDTDATDPAGEAEEACVPEGTKANSKGIGSFCSKTVKCGGDTFCTGDFGAPVGAQFCTIICAADSDCGEGARCFHEGRGNACIPNACKTDN